MLIEIGGGVDIPTHAGHMVQGFQGQRLLRLHWRRHTLAVECLIFCNCKCQIVVGETAQQQHCAQLPTQQCLRSDHAFKLPLMATTASESVPWIGSYLKRAFAHAIETPQKVI